jgi:hypothetical protein
MNDGFRVESFISENVRVKNMSMGGICLEINQYLSNNSSYRIGLGYSNYVSIMPEVMVVWSVLKKTVKVGDNLIPIYEVGLKFTDLNYIERYYLNKLISEHAS